MKQVILVGLGIGLLASAGCASGTSVWTRDAYVPPEQNMRGSQTFSPKTVISPYQNNASTGWPTAAGTPAAGSSTTHPGGSGTR